MASSDHLLDGIFLDQLLGDGEHVRFFFRGAMNLRQNKQPLGIHLGIGYRQRRHDRGRRLQLHARLRCAKQRMLAMRIFSIAQRSGQLLELRARILPFVLIVENLRALFLHLQTRHRILRVERGFQLRQRRRRGLAFVGKRILVVQKLVVLGGARILARRFVGLRAQKQKRRPRGRGGIGIQRINSGLRVASVDGGRSERLE